MDDSLYGWDKEGVFLNLQTTPFITKIMEESNILQANRFKKEEIEKAQQLIVNKYNILSI